VIGLETNVVIRYLAQDDAVQAWKALRAYESGSADFSDAIIAYTNTAHECEYTVTIDKQTSKLSEMRLL